LSPAPEFSSRSGFVRFRWPSLRNGQWSYLPETAQPFYSVEQYGQSFLAGADDYANAVAERIDPHVYDPQEKLDKILQSLINRLTQRVGIVREGWKKCSADHCPEGSLAWEMYSTPARDDMIVLMIDHLNEIIDRGGIDRDEVMSRMRMVKFRIAPDRSVTLEHIYQNAAWLSSDPQADVAARWGLEKCRMIVAVLRNATESIAFIEARYGKTDPQYGAQCISVQNAIIDKMTEELLRSECVNARAMMQ